MGKAKLADVIMMIDVRGSELGLHIHPEGRSFKATPLAKHMVPWRKLVGMFNQANVSLEQITLSSRDILAAETELRKLLFPKDGLLFSPSTMFHYTKDRAKFTLTINQVQPVRFAIESSTERLRSSNPKARGYVIALRDSEYCESATILSYGGISVDLTSKHSAASMRLAAYEALINLY